MLTLRMSLLGALFFSLKRHLSPIHHEVLIISNTQNKLVWAIHIHTYVISPYWARSGGQTVEKL